MKLFSYSEFCSAISSHTEKYSHILSARAPDVDMASDLSKVKTMHIFIICFIRFSLLVHSFCLPKPFQT